MRARDLAFLAGATGTAMFLYGALVEARRLTLERRTLALPRWPERLNGFRIALLADFHIHSRISHAMTAEAISLALDEQPDMVVLAGDFVDTWQGESPSDVGNLLEPLLAMEGNVVAVPGNHDYHGGDPSLLQMILDELNIKLLRNEHWRHLGVTWVGIDSAKEGKDDVRAAFHRADHDPIISVWHEPDLVDRLPKGVALQLSGHGHGGQFVFPGGFAPMHSKFGKKFPGGWYPDAPTPLYVTRGVGTTFLPTRFNCPPEVSLLTLVPA